MGGGPAERVLCILPNPEPKEILDRLRASHPEIEIKYIQRQWRNVGVTLEPLSDDIYKDVSVLFTLGELPKSREHAPNLKYVHLYSAGADRIVKHPIFLETDIIFSNSSGVHGPQISEWVIMTALVHHHKYNATYESQKLHKWDRSFAFNIRDFAGQRLGVLGYGAIGRQTARVAKAMGMDVIAYTATPKETPEQRADHGYIVPGIGDPDGSIPSKWYSGLDKQSLHNFLSQKIDVLVVSVPLTPETRHFLSKEEFDILGKHPPLISNIARGPIIDQPALVEALHDGRVAAAALDVTDPEPLPAGDPLWSAPNVIISPHISGGSVNYTDRSFDVLNGNLTRLAKGEPLMNVISRRKGY